MSLAKLRTEKLLATLQLRGVNATSNHAAAFRRAEKTLHHWAELECGDGNNFASWSIERDEKTAIPYLVTYPHNGKSTRRRIADKEKGALRRVAQFCAGINAHFFHQTDPRGCALYVAAEPLTDSNYTRGVACCD